MTPESDDLRAAVAAGLIDERQAAGVAALTAARRGERAALSADDEPFELFRGFNEVFVALGVALLGAGVWVMTGILSGTALAPIVFGGALAWALAEYFTIRRRMILPSILLSIGWAISATGMAAIVMTGVGDAVAAVVAALSGFAASLVFYWRFRVPFSLFVAAASAFIALLFLVGLVDPAGFDAFDEDGPAALFDLNQAGWVAFATLIFGLAAFAVAMRFDLGDPHRVSRLSACAFWLHLIAAPAIVNTVLLTLYNLGSAVAMIAVLALIACLTAVALVIDRRSFLVSALLYLGLLLSFALESSGVVAKMAIPLLLGLFITGLGAGWTRIRTALMRAIPGFPGKDRLPPYVTDTP